MFFPRNNFLKTNNISSSFADFNYLSLKHFDNSETSEFITTDEDLIYYRRVSSIRVFITAILYQLLYLCFIIPNSFPNCFYGIVCFITGTISTFDMLCQYYITRLTEEDYKNNPFTLRFLVLIGVEKNKTLNEPIV
jgi:hypothetical protein